MFKIIEELKKEEKKKHLKKLKNFKWYMYNN